MVSYRECITELKDIINSEDPQYTIISGDFNSDPFKGRFYTELLEFVNNFNFFVSDRFLPNDSFTYISSNENCSTSWIDHIISSHDSLVNDISIEYRHSFYDHIPMYFSLSLPGYLNVPPIPLKDNLLKEFISWNKLPEGAIQGYERTLSVFLQNHASDALSCRNVNCNIQNHKTELDEKYDFVCSCLKRASSPLKTIINKNKFKQVIGWNEHCKNLHSTARNAFLNWIRNGRIRSGILFLRMKETRTAFKKALDFCKKNENLIKKRKTTRIFQLG